VVKAGNGTTWTATTAPNGSFALEVHHGAFEWKVSKAGYWTLSGSSSVGPMGSTEVPDMPLVSKPRLGMSAGAVMVLAIILILMAVAVSALLLRWRRLRSSG